MLYDLELQTRLKFATYIENIWSYFWLEQIEKYKKGDHVTDTTKRRSNLTNPNTIRLAMLTTCHEVFYSSNDIPLRKSLGVTKAL